MRRREFIAVFGAAAIWPSRALAQQGRLEQSRMRRLGVLTAAAESDPLHNTRAAALVEGLNALGWKEGSNLHIDWRLAGGDRTLIARFGANSWRSPRMYFWRSARRASRNCGGGQVQSLSYSQL
jgi:putative ABC transport system substrate-binding protein